MKYIKELQEFLQSELGDYGMKYEINLDEDYEEEEYYSVRVTKYSGDFIGDVRFRLSKGGIEVDLYEDNWENTCDFEWTVKYFWIALLLK